MDASSPFIKQLASSDRHTRDAALERLRTYLKHRKTLESLELMKLWKGLFFCMWMSDRARTQQQLARNLASLIEDVPNHLVVDFLEVFWQTMAREWMSIDALRMDKFLYLVRVYLEASFKHFAAKDWKDVDQLEKYICVLEETPFNPRDLQIPDGMRYHCLDIYVDELDRVDEKREGNMPVEKLLRPIRSLGKKTLSKVVRKRVEETLEDERLKDWLGDKEKSKDTEADEEWGGIED